MKSVMRSGNNPKRKRTYQDAFVHVPVLHVQTDPDDAAVVDLLVVQRQ